MKDKLFLEHTRSTRVFLHYKRRNLPTANINERTARARVATEAIYELAVKPPEISDFKIVHNKPNTVPNVMANTTRATMTPMTRLC